MPYDTEQLYDQALEAIQEHNLYFLADVFAHIGISKPTFYDHFPTGSNEFNEIKKQLQTNRIDAKVEMRSKWYESDNPTLQLAFYKMIASDDEYYKLANAKQAIDHTSKGEKLEGATVVIQSQGENPDVEEA